MEKRYLNFYMIILDDKLYEEFLNFGYNRKFSAVICL